MLSLEEYIAKRKKEDKIDEFNIKEKPENMRVCVNYVFEYFNNYINISEAEKRTVLENEAIDKYRKQLRDYDEEVREWLVSIYSEYNKKIKLSITSILKKDYFFYLYNSDKEFRSLSYDCYSKLIKKHPYLKEQTEMLFLFIKDYQRIKSSFLEYEKIYVSEEINQWIEETWERYQINIVRFAHDWIHYFYDNDDLWPANHKKKSFDEYIDYDYDYKQKNNLFNIDSLYRRMPKKPYTKGRKQEFEILFMYYWLHSVEGDNDYWQEYLEKTLPSLQSK